MIPRYEKHHVKTENGEYHISCIILYIQFIFKICKSNY